MVSGRGDGWAGFEQEGHAISKIKAKESRWQEGKPADEGKEVERSHLTALIFLKQRGEIPHSAGGGGGRGRHRKPAWD